MKERPIIFSGPMVRAILEGRKTQTRRVVKPQPISTLGYMMGYEKRYAIQCGEDYPDDESDRVPNPYGKPGDRLWVREAWAIHGGYVIYRADLDDWSHLPDVRWSPSIHMHRTSSRMALEITDVRVQRVQEISEADAIAEGVEPFAMSEADIADVQISDDSLESKEFWRAMGPGSTSARWEYQMLWDEINGKREEGKYAWAANPWVWALSFKPVAMPEVKR